MRDMQLAKDFVVIPLDRADSQNKLMGDFPVRVTVGNQAQDFEFALIVELDDVEALKHYLQAPAHAVLGQLFYTATAAALAYDYEFDAER